jgi:PAS domain S-box-containing protein
VGASTFRLARCMTLVCAAMTAALLSPRALDPQRHITQYGVQVWTTAQGLPSNAVNAVLQSREGYLWLGTEDGLVRFDGTQFTLYDRSTVPAFKVSDVTALVETPSGVLYAATTGGVVRFRDGLFTRFGQEQGLGEERVWAICEDGAEGLWIGTPHDGLYHLQGERVSRSPVLPSGSLEGVSSLVSAFPESYGLRPGERSGFYVGQGFALLLVSGGRSERLVLPEPFNRSPVTSVFPDRLGRLWVGTDMGVVRLSTSGPKPFTTSEGLKNDRIFFIKGDRDGNTWIGSYGGGLARVSPDDRVEVLTVETGLADDRPLCFLEDREGAAWIGTRGGGLNRLVGGPAIPFTTVQGLSSDKVYSIFQDRKGALWLGTAGGGVNRIEEGKVTSWTIRQGLSGDSVYALFEDRDRTLWAGTGDGRLNRFDGRGFTTVRFQPEGSRAKVACIAQDKDGTLWVGTRGGGLWARRGGRFEPVTSGDRPPGWGIYSIHFDSDGTMWLGTSEGLYRRDAGGFTHCLQEPDLGREKVFGLCRDGSGNLWLTTYSGGLICYRDGHARRITGEFGLGKNTFYQALDDGKGSLWLTSNSGILVVALADLEAFLGGRSATVRSRVLGIEEGLLTLECNGGGQPSACLASDGHLWFPTARGAVAVDPKGLASLGPPPPAHVQSLLVNGQPVSLNGGVGLPRGAGALEIRFSVPSLLHPGRYQVSYQLEGFDRDWIPAGRRRTAYYTNVPAGRFRFRVRSEDGPLTGPEAALPIHLEPPLYRHPLFLALLAALIAAVGFAAYRLRVGLLERRGRLLEETVARRTAELTSERDRVQAVEERYRAVVEGQTEMICRFAPDGTLLFANEALARLWGQDPEKIHGENLFELLPESVRQGTRDGLATLTRSEPFRMMEQRVTVTGGSLRVHQWSVRAFFDTQGHVTGYQAVGRDVTELRRLREQLVQAQKMEAIGLLAGGVAHDFNNLLQAMLSAAGTLRRTCATCDRGEAVVREIEQDIHRAAQLTRQLLLFARRETARPEALDLNMVAKGVDGLLRRFLRENIVFEISLCEGALPVRADVGQLEQAVVNLVVNACDAMPDGGRLVLSTGREGRSFAWFSVRDSGPGIPEELKGRIFEPFFTTKGVDQGTGLGLSVVLGIVQRNGGTIEVVSPVGGGAEFKVVLPLMEEPLPEALGAGSVLPGGRERPQHRVLLVEDAAGVREWLGEALSMLGYRVTSASTMRAAMDRLEEGVFDVILSDVLLPDGSGVDIARRAAALKPSPALVLVSGYSRDDVLRREVMEGNVRFLQKPFGIDALEREMAAALTEAGPTRNPAPS